MPIEISAAEKTALGLAFGLPLVFGALAIARWPSEMQPTVVAALVAAGVGVLTVAVNSTLNHKQHREKIRADIALAERRFQFDKDIAEAKTRLETQLHIDKKRADFAETALKDFYDARARIREIRSPAGFAGENDDRVGRSEEPPELRAARDQYYPCLRRVRLATEYFNAFYARRYTAIALFGPAADEPYVGIWSAIATIQSFAMSAMRPTPVMTPSVIDHLELVERAIWHVPGEIDQIANDVDLCVALAEATFRPALVAGAAESPFRSAL